MPRPFDRYEYYLRSVQDPPSTVRFLQRLFRERRGRDAQVLGEDFCAAFSISCAWVKSGPRRHAIGVDLDPEPLAYGRKHYANALSDEARSRLMLYRSDVLSPRLPSVEMIASLNFSYYVFHTREQLVAYFRNCRRRLGKHGVFVLDAFGGPETQKANQDREKRDGFFYYWEQANFDPISHRATFYIHFQRPGERTRKRVFKYDWRMWTIPELREALVEAGFPSVDVYWEGADGKGAGNGVFRRRLRGEADAAWVAYLVAS